MIKKKNDTAKIVETAMSLSKYLALSGVASRRKATEIIEGGGVTVNGEVIREPGFRVPENAMVKAQGKIIRPEEKVYILLNKPKDYITTLFDEKGRKTIMDLIDIPHKVRLYPVGRLDRVTTGLLVLTNDGELALRLAHPRYQVSKIYHVTLDKLLKNNDFKKLGHEGIDLEDGHVDIDTIGFVQGAHKNELIIELHSGKNRIVRRIFEALGYEVVKLDRVGYAGLNKQGLRHGQWRFLKQYEINALKNLKAAKVN